MEVSPRLFLWLKSMLKLNETEIIQQAYTLVEADTTDWSTSSDEYLAARRFANAAVNKWESAVIELEGSQIPVRWRELWTTLTEASDGTKTTSSSVYSYSCPSNFARPSSYVRLVDSSGNVMVYDVKQAEATALLDRSFENWCYFRGNSKDGFTLHFNPNLTIPSGSTIRYEYYKNATTFTATDSKSEIPDDYMIVHFIVAMFYKDEDPATYKTHMDIANTKLNQMIADNQSGLYAVDDKIPETLSGEDQEGFGY